MCRFSSRAPTIKEGTPWCDTTPSWHCQVMPVSATEKGWKRRHTFGCMLGFAWLRRHPFLWLRFYGWRPPCALQTLRSFSQRQPAVTIARRPRCKNKKGRPQGLVPRRAATSVALAAPRHGGDQRRRPGMTFTATSTFGAEKCKRQAA